MDVPLVLMNSFNTDKETQKIIKKYKTVRVLTFKQKQCPRFYKQTLLPVPKDASQLRDGEWYPPGHGDIYDSLTKSELLQVLKNEGKKYLFIANIDNLGAIVDTSMYIC